ncbi:MAG TPA: ATP-binding protein, partial [Clostridia bacterium]|nr:ATP-binding protein [Clostridia bacterium]
MILTLPLAPVEDTASILKRQFFYITAILLASSLLIAWKISKSFTKPILEIEKATESMAKGDFTARIKLNKQDEIGKLALSINYLGEQLSKIEQLRKDLIANISHELRTPLSLIRGYAETIRDVTGESREKREKQIGIIIEETERLSGMVDDVLNLSQLQSGYVKLERVRFSIKELVEAVIKRYEVLSEKTQVTLLAKVDRDTVLEADKARIEQVLYNLINNAFNHTPQRGSIQVNVDVHKGAVRFKVTDTGSGINEEDLPHIWERFYKADRKDNKRSVGTGLGLAITKSILDAHHALYGVESIKGAGSTFWFEMSVHSTLEEDHGQN